MPLTPVTTTRCGLPPPVPECLFRHGLDFREGWRGYLWQGRFASYPLDQPTVRYVERNPVKAGLVMRAEDYPWSSARAHVWREPGPVLSPNFLVEDIRDWRAFLAIPNEWTESLLECHSRTGRPSSLPE